MSFWKRRKKEEVRIINGYKVRERGQVCPGCHAAADRWCSPNCEYLDIMDYR